MSLHSVVTMEKCEEGCLLVNTLVFHSNQNHQSSYKYYQHFITTISKWKKKQILFSQYTHSSGCITNQGQNPFLLLHLALIYTDLKFARLNCGCCSSKKKRELIFESSDRSSLVISIS